MQQYADKNENNLQPAAHSAGKSGCKSGYTLKDNRPQKVLQQKQADTEVIQRLAGIEYETGIEARLPGYDVANGINSNWVPQDQEMLVSNHGWNIVSDNSKLEFVTEPPVTTANLRGVVDHMLGTIGALQAPNPNASNFNTLFGQFNPPVNYYVFPYQQKVITGALQGTVGIPFGRLFAFFKLLTKYGLEANEQLIRMHRNYLLHSGEAIEQLPDADPTKAAKQTALVENKAKLREEERAGTPAIRPANIELYGNIYNEVNNAVNALQANVAHIADRQARALEQTSLYKLKGLLHFVGQYAVFASRYTNSYKKKSFPVMARSSFHSMFGDLSVMCRQQFVPLATQIIQAQGLDIGQRVFANAEENVGADADFTLAEWLQSIQVPVIRNIPDGQGGFRQMASDRMTAPATNMHDTDKSMGSMGLDNGLVVVELRSIKHLARLATHDPDSAKKIVEDLAKLESA